MNPRIVGRSDTGGEPSTCLHCKQPFRYGVNVFTREGMKEIAISGMCESCFDGLFDENGDVPQDDSPYCDCCYSHGIEENDFNQCDSCGKPIYPEDDNNT